MNRQVRLPRAGSERTLLVGEDLHVVTAGGLAFGSDHDLILATSPLGCRVDVKNPHDGRDRWSAFSFANFSRT